MFKQLEEIEEKFALVEKSLSSSEITSDPKKLKELNQEYKQLQPIVETFKEYKQKKKNFEDNLELIQKEKGELAELAKEENKELKKNLEELEEKLKILLLPKDPNDEKDVLLEIRAGAGGDEAGIFAADLLRMYLKYAEKMQWKVELLSQSHNSVGGFKEVIANIKGEGVYSRLKFESGVHRVQRVPKTEAQGRIHTSTVTVAVLPEADDVEVEIDPKELRIDVFRSSGPGGQSVNTTDSAVRITHIPSGLVVTCQDEKSQHKNKAKALKILKTRLLDLERQKQQQEISEQRKAMVGTGDRSEKIRTYNFPQGRVTDHRIGKTIYQLDTFMEGHIDEMINSLITHYQAESLKRQSFK